jgi:hypothetical protein
MCSTLTAPGGDRLHNGHKIPRSLPAGTPRIQQSNGISSSAALYDFRFRPIDSRQQAHQKEKCANKKDKTEHALPSSNSSAARNQLGFDEVDLSADNGPSNAGRNNSSG